MFLDQESVRPTVLHRQFGLTGFFTRCFFLIVLFALGQTAQCQPPPPITITLVAPPVIEAGANLDFYVKCKLVNLSHDRIDTVQNARLYLIDSASQTQKLLHYTAGLYKGPNIDHDESTTWWQHSRALAEGRYKIFAHWDGNDDVRSTPISVTIKRTTALPSDEVPDRNRALRHFADRFPELVPNTSTATVSYTRIHLTKDPIDIDGLIYSAISFIAPPGGGDLEWSFVIPQFGQNTLNWYIIGADDDIHGFYTFYRDTVVKHIPGIAEPKDLIICQTLSSSELTPGHRYYIWFQCPYRDIPDLVISLNIFPGGTYPFYRIFHGVYDGTD